MFLLNSCHLILVIDTCNKYGIAMAFCGIRLFHH